MASVLARSPSPGFFDTHAYAAAKAAIWGSSTTAAAYYAPHGHPLQRRAAGPHRHADEPSRHERSADPGVRAEQATPRGRPRRPTADLDAAVVFLLSDDSRFVTGQALAVDGGWSVSDGSARNAP